MDLSVIIVNWNTRELVLESLRSLYRAWMNGSMEVFVVDNGSSDGSVEAIRAAFPGAILIEKRKNLGFASANNEAIRYARGKYILLLNTDGVKSGRVRLIAVLCLDPAGVASNLGNADLINYSQERVCSPAFGSQVSDRGGVIG